MVVLAVMAVLLTALILNAPRGFPTDLSKIGQETPALVFVYDPNLTVSATQTAEMNEVRDPLQERIHFLLADIGRPDAQAFVAKHQASSGDLLIFSESGSLIARQRAPLPAAPLEEWIKTSIGD